MVCLGRGSMIVCVREGSVFLCLFGFGSFLVYLVKNIVGLKYDFFLFGLFKVVGFLTFGFFFIFTFWRIFIVFKIGCKRGFRVRVVESGKFRFRVWFCFYFLFFINFIVSLKLLG